MIPESPDSSSSDDYGNPDDKNQPEDVFDTNNDKSHFCVNDQIEDFVPKEESIAPHWSYTVLDESAPVIVNFHPEEYSEDIRQEIAWVSRHSVRSITCDFFVRCGLRYRRIVSGVLQHLSKPSLSARLDWNRVQFVPLNYFDLSGHEKFADSVVQVFVKKPQPRNDDPFVVHFVEHKSHYDPKAIIQVSGYEWRAIEQMYEHYGRPYPTCTYVLIQGRAPRKYHRSLRKMYHRVPGFRQRDLFQNNCRLIFLQDLDDEHLPSKEEFPAVHAFLKIARDYAKPGYDSRFLDDVRCFALDKDVKTMRRLGVILLGFAFSRIPNISQQTLEQAAQLLLAEEGDKIMLSYAQQLEMKGKAEGKAEGIAEGKAKGIAEGKAKGIVEGKAKGKVESILSILTSFFGEQAKQLKSPLEQVRDLVVLDSMVVSAAQCKSLNEFRNTWF